MKTVLFAVLLAMTAATAHAAERAIESRPPLRAPPGRAARFDSAHAYDVQSYTLRIAVPMNNDSLYGWQHITAAATTTGLDTAALNCAGLAVDSVRQDGAAAGFRLSGDTLRAGIAPAMSGDHFSLDIYYRGGGFGSGYYWYPQGGGSGQALRTVSYTMSAPQGARSWMPCFDEPWDKADSGCALYITAPGTYTVAANGLLADTVRSGGSMTWHWREDHAIATYLMAFHVSQYASWSDTARTASGDTIPLNYFVWSMDSTKSRAVFDSVPAMMGCFSQKFGRYPFSKYGMAAVAPFMFGGMENQTMTTIIRDWIASNDQYGIAHELSHMWFGDLVTCGTWADIWLNEGFASYCEAVYSEQVTGNAPGRYMTQNFASALSGNALTYPIYDPPMSLIYDVSMEYAKGAWVLQMLRGVMGDSLFFPMMRAYADSFAYRCAVTADFQRIAEQHFGQPLGWFFDQWVRRAGHPTYNVVAFYKTRPDSNSAYVRLRQSSTTGELYTMPVQLACSTSAGMNPSRVVVWVNTGLTDSVFFTDTLPVKRIMIDPDNRILQEHSHLNPSITTIAPGNGQLTINWNVYRADARPVAGYLLYRSRLLAGPYLRIDPQIIADTAYTDTGLTNGTRYYYKLTALMGADTCYETKFSGAASQKPTGIAGGPAGHSDIRAVRLEQNRPNPFQRSTLINYQLTEAGRVQLRVYNAAGQLVRTLVSEQQPAGRHSATWDGATDDGDRVAAGVYLCRLAINGHAFVKNLNLIK